MQTGFSGRREAYSLRGLRILLVEEFPFMVILMSSMLREFGVGQVLSTDNMDQAKQLITQHNGGGDDKALIDILITDLMGPGHEGLELLTWARSHKKDSIKYLPVLFSSTYTSVEIVEKARDKGTNEILMKPVSAEKLASRLLYIIDHPRPFVKAPEFFGPDRRRKTEKFAGEEKRVRSEDDVTVSHEKE